MSELISTEHKTLAWELYDKINKLAPEGVVINEDTVQMAESTVVKFGYIKDSLSEAEELSAAEKVIQQMFTAVYDDLLATGHTRIFWRVAPTWIWERKPAWDEVYLRARYTLFTPKERKDK